MAVAVWSGSAQVVAHGTVTAFGGNGLYFEIELPEQLFKVAIRFLSDVGVEGPAVNTVTMAEGAGIELVNFDGPEGRGSAMPALLADLGENLLFWHFRAFRYGRSEDRTLHYTFFHVAKSDVGWTPVGTP